MIDSRMQSSPRPGSEVRLDRDALGAPWEVMSFDVYTGEMARPEQPLLVGSAPTAIWLLVRFDGEPIGQAVVPASALTPHGVGPLAEKVRPDRIAAMRAQVAAVGKSPAAVRRARASGSGVGITGVVCTTASRPDGLARCLESLRRQTYGRSHFLVVDNSPGGSARALCRTFLEDSRFSYIHEPRPGLSRARNASINAVSTPLIAWLDDDEIADPTWLDEYVAIFADNPGVDVACGMMAPAELATRAQLWFEQWGGHSKGRGFDEELFRDEPGHQSPLYPLPAFGSGGNMAYRLHVIKALGGFDTALGAGTPSGGAEDTRAFTETLLRGGSMVFSPRPITFHYHRADEAGLYAQLEGYGIGITAFYTSILRSHPTKIVALLRQLPRASTDLRDRGSLRNRSIPADFPSSVLRANRRGLLRGPYAYCQGVFENRRHSVHRTPTRHVGLTK